MKRYLFFQVLLVVWIRVVPSFWPLKPSPLTEARHKSYFQLKIKVGFFCATFGLWIRASSCEFEEEWRKHAWRLVEEECCVGPWMQNSPTPGEVPDNQSELSAMRAQNTHPPKMPLHSFNSKDACLVKSSTHALCYSILLSLDVWLVVVNTYTCTTSSSLYGENPQMQVAGPRSVDIIAGKCIAVSSRILSDPISAFLSRGPELRVFSSS